VSNAGDPESVVLNNMQDRGRAAAKDGGDHIAFAEYSAKEDAALDDPAAIAAANPALNTLIKPAAVLEELRTLPAPRYRTEVLCQRVATAARTALDTSRWRDVAGDPEPFDPATARPYLGFDLDPERTVATLVAAQWADDRLVVHLVEEWRHTEAVDELAILADLAAFVKRWRPASMGYAPASSGSIPDNLTGVKLTKIAGQEYYTACQQLVESVTNGTLLHAGDEHLSRPVLAAVRRDAGDGYWYLSRRDSEDEISAAVALARAVYLAYRPTPQPFIA
jgi:hypothetical protein